ncbi:O-antigen polymerase [Allofournierella massiliensis]|uniref:O-antigen polymerase n=1 Tax=Allofournierella massiliensis TaxID=1650663 RepID=UPI0024B1DC69|nr:O-antigen polymerase [Fournierella massiliensis]
MNIAFMISSLVLFVALGKKIQGNIGSLSYLTGILWMIYVLFSYVFMKEYYSFSMIGIIWINAAFWVMLLMERLGRKKATSKFQCTCKTTAVSKQSWLYLKVCLVLGLVAFFYQISLYGFQLSSFSSLSTLASMNNTVAVARYSGNGIVNNLTQVLLVFVYAAPACGGYAFAYSDGCVSDKIWAIATVFPAVLMVLFTNTKAVVLGAGMLWASAYLVAYFSKQKKFLKLSFRMVCLLLVICICFLVFMIFSMVLRMGEVSQNTLEIALRKFQIYAFGSVQSFDWWCGEIYRPEYRIGEATYLGVFDFLGLAEKVQGVYTAGIGTSSNVFTMFRGVIEDYGYVGGIAYLGIKTFICGFCIGQMYVSSRIRPIMTAFLVAHVFFLVYGFFVSPWTYMSYILSIFVFAGYLFTASSRSIRVTFGNKVLI